MNLKRKWEAYRCVVCCLNQPIGSSKDTILMEEALNDPSGLTFQKLYGQDGVFSNTGILKRHNNIQETDKYGIIAAGSFTDLINYGISGITGITQDDNGLYLSRDISKNPYNQTIGEFYNLTNDDTFIQSILDKSKKEYETTLLINKKRLNEISKFLLNVDSWIISGISFINENTINCEECNESINRESVVKTVNNYWSLNTLFSNSNITEYFKKAFNYLGISGFSGNTCDIPFEDGSYSKGIPCGFKEIYSGPYIPITSFNGSSGSSGSSESGVDVDNIYHGPYLKIEGISERIPYIELGPKCCLRTINFGNTYGNGEKLTGLSGPVDKFSYIPKFQYLPVWCQECSNNIFMRGKDNLFFEGLSGPSGASAINEAAKSITYNSSADYHNQQSIWGISERYGAIPALCGISGASENDPNTPRVSYNESCFNPNILIALKKHAKSEYNALLVETFLLTKIMDLNLIQGARKSLKQQIKEWRDRPAFFYSKTPGSSIFYKGLTGGGIQIQGSTGNIGEGNTKYRSSLLKQPTSLQGIKSITRKDIRGSRYEILAKTQGISGSSLGNWVYNIAFGNENPGPGNTINLGISDKDGVLCGSTKLPQFHPYYDQGFIGTVHGASGVSGASGAYYNNNQIIPINKHYNKTTYLGLSGEYPIKTPTMLLLFGASGASGGNVLPFDIKINSIPPNLKRETIASYVRVEFTNPIGLDRIADFPSGFVRNAGCEYFLPYLVSLTSGPVGRQSIRNNIAVIGMDPHGFDVAVKKMKIESQYDAKNYWWWEGGNPDITQTDLTRNGMDLWPEFMFETEFPYYTANPFGVENLLTDDEKLNKKDPKWKRSAEFDPERRKTAMGSGYIMSSHRKIKPHRSWWSCYIPQNLFIPQKLHSIINEMSSNFKGEICQFYRHGYVHTKAIQNDDFDGWFIFTGSTHESGPDSITELLKNTKFEGVL